MQVFHVWPLVTALGDGIWRPFFAEVLSEVQLKRDLPFVWMVCGWTLAL